MQKSRGTRRMTDDQIAEARSLRALGWSKRGLARRYGVGVTTVWENVYRNGPRPPRPVTYRTARPVRLAIMLLKSEDMNSRQVAGALGIDERDVNWLWTRLTIKRERL